MGKVFGRTGLAVLAAAPLSLGVVGSASAELVRGVEDGGCTEGVQVGTMTVKGRTDAICRTV
jgi:hypothetical protein